MQKKPLKFSYPKDCFLLGEKKKPNKQLKKQNPSLLFTKWRNTEINFRKFKARKCCNLSQYNFQKLLLCSRCQKYNGISIICTDFTEICFRVFATEFGTGVNRLI